MNEFSWPWTDSVRLDSICIEPQIHSFIIKWNAIDKRMHWTNAEFTCQGQHKRSYSLSHHVSSNKFATNLECSYRIECELLLQFFSVCFDCNILWAIICLRVSISFNRIDENRPFAGSERELKGKNKNEKSYPATLATQLSLILISFPDFKLRYCASLWKTEIQLIDSWQRKCRQRIGK